jgi:hypothetical protein
MHTIKKHKVLSLVFFVSKEGISISPYTVLPILFPFTAKKRMNA